MPNAHCRLTGCLFVLALAAAARAGDHWPAFRGPSADGHSDAVGLPTSWSETENVVWKTAVPGKAWSSPVILGTQIWLTNADEKGTKLSAVCIDRDSGKVLHDILVFAIEKPAFCHKFNSYASSTPVIEPGRLYVHYGSAGTACLDTGTGKILWTRQDLPCDHFRGAGSSPILHDGKLILTFDGYDHQYVAALDKNDGKTLWRHDRNLVYAKNDGDWKKAYSTPAAIEVNGRTLLVCPSAQCTSALDPADGKEVWRVDHGGMNVASRPIYDRDRKLLWLTTGYSGLQLFALRPDGAGDVTKSHVAWSYNKGVPTRPSLIQVGGLLFLISDGGVLTCVDADGKEVAKKRIGGNFSASPVCAEGRIYICNEAGATSVLKADQSLAEVGSGKLESGCMASPAIVGKAIYIRTKTHLYRIEKK